MTNDRWKPNEVVFFSSKVFFIQFDTITFDETDKTKLLSADHPSGVVLHQIWILDDRDQSVVSLEPVYVMSDLFHTVTQFLPEDCPPQQKLCFIKVLWPGAIVESVKGLVWRLDWFWGLWKKWVGLWQKHYMTFMRHWCPLRKCFSFGWSFWRESLEQR